MASYTFDYEHDGIEISFETKPSYDVLSELKAAHWKWHSGKQVWYKKRSDDAENMAIRFCLPMEYTEVQGVNKTVASFTQKDIYGNQSSVCVTKENDTIHIESTNNHILCPHCNNFVAIDSNACPVCGTFLQYIATQYLHRFGQMISQEKKIVRRRTREEAEEVERLRRLTRLKESYVDFWKDEYEQTGLYDIVYLRNRLFEAKKQKEKEIERKKELEVRRAKIALMDPFYREHCGYSQNELETMYYWTFDKISYLKESLKSIAYNILKEACPKEAIDLYRSRYLLFFELQDISFRERLNKLLSESREESYCPRCGKSFVKHNDEVFCSQCSPLYGLNNELNRLRLHSGVFWEYLKIYGGNLRPIDRTAAYVSMGETAFDGEESYVDRIKKTLTFDTIDNISKIIKPHFINEMQEMLSKSPSDLENTELYLCALYSELLNRQAIRNTYLKLYVEAVSPEKVILDNEKKVRKNKWAF